MDFLWGCARERYLSSGRLLLVVSGMFVDLLYGALRVSVSFLAEALKFRACLGSFFEAPFNIKRFQGVLVRLFVWNREPCQCSRRAVSSSNEAAHVCAKVLSL